MEILQADTFKEAVDHVWNALDDNEISREDYWYIRQNSYTPKEMMERLALAKEAHAQALVHENNQILLYNQSVQQRQHPNPAPSMFDYFKTETKRAVQGFLVAGLIFFVVGFFNSLFFPAAGICAVVAAIVYVCGLVYDVPRVKEQQRNERK